jgi:hypothetical protein
MIMSSLNNNKIWTFKIIKHKSWIVQFKTQIKKIKSKTHLSLILMRIQKLKYLSKVQKTKRLKININLIVIH